MTLASNTYGTTDEVAALTPRFGDATTHLYTTATRPTLAQVEKWCDRVSGFLNVLLSEQGFAIPITQTDVLNVLATFVITEVADLCNYANSAGRFFSDKQTRSGPWQNIQKEAEDFITNHAEGLAKLGASRTTAGMDAMAFRDVDGGGDSIEPMFSRKQFGTHNTNWDPDV